MKLKGFLQSGVLYIGDPQYLSGPVQYGTVPVSTLSGKELTPAIPVDITPEDPYNPFRSWDRFAAKLGEDSALSLPFEGASIDSDGRGVAIQTKLSGQYEVSRMEDETGKLLELRITFKD